MDYNKGRRASDPDHPLSEGKHKQLDLGAVKHSGSATAHISVSD